MAAQDSQNNFYPFQLQEAEDGEYYVFPTEAGWFYGVRFNSSQYDSFFKDCPFFLSNAWGFVFSRKPIFKDPKTGEAHSELTKSPTEDPKISFTMGKIIEVFLDENPDRVCVYDCNEPHATVFSRWEKRHEDGDGIIHIQLEIQQGVGEQKVGSQYFGFFFMGNNPQVPQIISDYHSFCNQFTDSPLHTEVNTVEVDENLAPDANSQLLEEPFDKDSKPKGKADSTEAEEAGGQ